MDNTATLSGRLVNGFVFSHEAHYENFYSATLSVQRTSGTQDFVPLIVSEKLMDSNVDYTGRRICIHGRFKSRNVKDDNGTRHIQLYVFADRLELLNTDSDYNEIVLDGFICSPPKYRTTPLGREITDIIVAVNRNCGKSDYIPCVCWGRNAQQASSFKIGEQVTLSGRIQSRNYIKLLNNTEQTKTAYEVSVSSIA